MTTERDCKHGQLARSCNVCELEAEVARQTAEIERLTACLKRANDNHEHFEREWYLRGEVLDKSEALLLQALVLLRGPAPNGYGVGSEQEAVIAAIKTHLGEV